MRSKVLCVVLLFSAILLVACGALPSPSTTPVPTEASPGPTASPPAPTASPQPTPALAPLVVPPPATPLSRTLAGPINPANAASVVEVARWGGGGVSDVAFSPDGRQVLLFTSLGAEARDAATLAEQPFLAPEPGWSLAALSADWQTSAWVSGSQIRLRRLSDGAVLRTLEGQPGVQLRAAFSPDGSLLASLNHAPGEEAPISTGELWRLSDGTRLPWSAQGAGLAWSPDGRLLATWFAMSGVEVWSMPGGALVYRIEGGAVDAAFSPDGQCLALAAFGCGVELYRVSDWARQWRLEPCQGAVRFSPDGALLVAAPEGGEARLVRALDGQTVRAVGSGLGEARAVSFSPDGQVLALGTSRDVQFWRVADGALLGTLEGHGAGVTGAAISADGTAVAFLTREPSSPGASMSVWDLSGGIAVPLPDSAGALSFAWAPGGESAALGTWEFDVRLVQVPTGKETRTLGGIAAQVQSVAFSPSGDRVAASAMAEVRLWQVADGTLLQQWRVPHGGWMVSATFSPDGSLVAAQAAMPDGAVWVWDAGSGQVVLHLEGGYSDYLAFLPGGTVLAAEKPGVVELWSLTEGRLIRRLEVAGDAGPFALAPDGALLALSAGERVELRAVADGTLLAILEGHRGWVGSVAFSPDGRFLVTGSEDGTVRLWGVPADGG